ncbi:hypothetical protein BV898_14015 [Hypsibius exemplaris]|uniref:Glycine zipper 2TM domain-containing protein n=1 Tax=Hypsibius exemplaris TaxID=2072580 RepID=A0A1W0W8Y4_HYPEX|nr:hypothetical protein BV898_14015 [Hypsibius exemplaris]
MASVKVCFITVMAFCVLSASCAPLEREKREGAGKLTGALAGGVVGAAVGGPLGAVAGAVLGGVAGHEIHKVNHPKVIVPADGVVVAQ